MAEGFEQSGADERTENATQFRREEFRRQGRVALSRELVSVGMLLLLGGGLFYGIDGIFKEFIALVKEFFVVKKDYLAGKNDVLKLFSTLAKSYGLMVMPVFLTAFVAAIAVCGAQVGFLFTTEPLGVKWERLDPIQGITRIFSWNGAIEAVKAGVKLGLVGWVAWSYLKNQTGLAPILLQKTPIDGTHIILITALKLFLVVVAALIVIAAADYAYQRFQLEKQMKMTKREAKEEFKLREGDPLIKSRIRSLQRRLASKRMMNEVPKADVVVTNPTHFAVALKYDPDKMVAPKVVAKGAGVIALKIKEIARFNRVPVVENRPLARTLFKTLDVGEYIPRELYKAVAEVLSYVYRLKSFTPSFA